MTLARNNARDDHPPRVRSSDPTDASTREALESILYGNGLHGDPSQVPDELEPDGGDADTGGSVALGGIAGLGGIAAPLLAEADVRDVASEPVASDGSGGEWAVIVRAEEARWRRYQRPCVAVQLEVVGGAELEHRLGQEAAARVRAILDEVVATTTRESDRYWARSAWRMAGLLLEVDDVSAEHALERIKAAFASSIGPALAMRLAVGWATPERSGTIPAAFNEAARSLATDVRGTRAQAASSVPDHDPPSAAAAGAPADQGVPVGPDHEIRRSLETLSRLVADDLISQAEYEAKRAEVLARL